jgi:DNA-binding beta-propeller fold protein YncE
METAKGHNQEGMMKKAVIAAALTVVAAGAPAFAQTPEIPFDFKADLISLPAYGEVAGVATNSKGDIYVYARTGHAVATLGDERTFYHGGSRLFQFDKTGKFLREVGQGTYSMNFAQQVRVDPQDNVWAVDSGSNMIMKFDSNGRLLRVFGRRPEAIAVRPGPGVPARTVDDPPAVVLPSPLPPPTGTTRPPAESGEGIPGQSFNRVSDVAWDAAGNAYVADGWGTNNRVSKFGTDGNFIKSWGRTGSSRGQFRELRGIAVDAGGNVYVADAGNRRIQVFDGDGNYKTEFGGFGTPMAICLTGGSPQHLYVSNSNDPETLDYGEIYKVRLNGQIVGKFGRAGKIPGEFSVTNALDCRTEKDLLVGEVGNWRVTKVTLK